MKKKEKIEIFVDPKIKEKLRSYVEGIGGTMAGVIKVILNDFLKKL